jgi:ATP-dependent RNA helicase HelY
MGRRTGTLARKFRQVLRVLEHFDYVDEWKLTSKGDTLARVYNESDLLVVEALERHLLDDLQPAELAAVCSSLVYETRGPEAPVIDDLPTHASEEAWKSLMKLWRQIRKVEDTNGLELTREPDPGFAERAYAWASGAPLENVLGEGDAPGDFVRSTKQLVDLLRQLEEVAPSDELRAKVMDTVRAIHRGVVAYSSL